MKYEAGKLESAGYCVIVDLLNFQNQLKHFRNTIRVSNSLNPEGLMNICSYFVMLAYVQISNNFLSLIFQFIHNMFCVLK